MTLWRLPLPSLKPLAPVPPVAHKPRHSSWERHCPQGCGHVGSCVSLQRPHPILTPLLQAARKDGAGCGRLGSDTPLSCKHLPGVITPLPLLSLSDLTLNTGPNPAERGLDGFAGFYRRLRDPRRDITRVTDNCPRHGGSQNPSGLPPLPPTWLRLFLGIPLPPGSRSPQRGPQRRRQPAPHQVKARLPLHFLSQNPLLPA